MAHLSKIFTKVPVEISNRSAFDLSHENLFTAKCGTLVPCLVEELLPNDTISVGQMLQVQLPPMVSDFYGRVDACCEAFFVPNRLLWGGWQDFITNPTTAPYGPSISHPKSLPSVSFTQESSLIQRGSLFDYLGYKCSSLPDSLKYTIPNLLPFLAYHKIYEDWYMNTEIQKTPFEKMHGNFDTVKKCAISPSFGDTYTVDMTTTAGSESSILNDGVSLFSLRQRLWAKDYFTTANLYAQAGGASSLSFDVSDNKGSFTIASLRAANALQRWLERNNIAGYRYADQIKAQFGVLPSDATMQRSIFLGRNVVNVYTKSIYSTAATAEVGSARMPFKGAAAKFGSSQAIGEGSLIDSFTATEHGYIFVLFSLVPHAYYSTGCRRHLMRSQVGDFAFPLMQGVGEQAIYSSELGAPTPNLKSSIFGYTDQYAEYKYHDDEVHGLLVDNENLEAFALQRGFTTAPVLGTDFLEIPTTFLDQVTAIDAGMSLFGCWVDSYFTEKKISSLAAYQIPTLGDVKNTHREYLDKGGRRL